MLKSWVHFADMSTTPKSTWKGPDNHHKALWSALSGHHGLPTHTYSQTHTWETLWGHCFLIHLCTCLYLLPILPFFHVWVSPSHRKKRKEKQRGWIWAEKHPLGLFPFLKELLQISCLIYEGGLRRDTSWHDRQSPSLSGKTWIGPDQGWYASPRHGPGVPQTGQQLGAKPTLSLEPERG